MADDSTEQLNADGQDGNILGGCLGIVVLCLTVATCIVMVPGKSDEEVAAEKRLGYHCLNRLDVSHIEFKRRVQSLQREPDSFEHIETKLSRKNSDGSHDILMKYRSRNGFGGMTVSVAAGKMDNETCEISNIDPS